LTKIIAYCIYNTKTQILIVENTLVFYIHLLCELKNQQMPHDYQAHTCIGLQRR